MDNLEVALTKELCPICCKEMDGSIVMNQILTEKEASKVKDLHNKVVGFSNHCCDECAKHKDEVVYFIGIDGSKSSSKSLEDLYRTGQVAGVKKDANILKYFKSYIITLKDSAEMVIIDEDAGKKLGIFSSNA